MCDSSSARSFLKKKETEQNDDDTRISINSVLLVSLLHFLYCFIKQIVQQMNNLKRLLSFSIF